MKKIKFKWTTVKDIQYIDELVELFVGNISNNYISHGEVIDGRANSINEWKPEIREIMKEEFTGATGNTFNMTGTFTKLSFAVQDGSIVALALVSFYPDTKIAVLSDIVVNTPARGQKTGESMLKWIETEVKLWGAKFIFLESGLNNQSAHHFFENMGFKTTSIVMAKKI